MRELGWERKYLRCDKGRAYFYVKGEEPLPKLTVTSESGSRVRPIPFAWLLVYLIVVLTRGVRRGLILKSSVIFLEHSEKS